MIAAILGSYIVTLVLAKGSIFNSVRAKLIEKTPWLQKQAMWNIGPLPAHYFECRLCLAALVSAFFAYGFDVNWFLVYGGSYFLATQER